MAADGFCIVFISHKLDEVLQVADRITVMRRGRVVGTTTPAETDRRALARMMVGRELASFVEQTVDVSTDAALPLGDPVVAREVVLELRGLRATSDKGLPALAGIDLEVRAGETLGIAGVAGNGQRELAEAITGLRRVTGGQVRIGGRVITNASPAEIARAGVAHVPEDRLATGLVSGMDVAGNVILRDYQRPPLARGPFLVSRAIASFADRLIQEYDVQTPGRGTRVGALSGGNQQKLLLARELSGEPRVLVAVHPTRGVDVGATETIHALLRAQRERGAATLLISEDLDELLALCDRIAVLYEGRVMGTVPVVGADPEYLGLLMAGGDEAPALGRVAGQTGG